MELYTFPRSCCWKVFRSNSDDVSMKQVPNMYYWKGKGTCAELSLINNSMVVDLCHVVLAPKRQSYSKRIQCERARTKK